jgi:hypothetical protein
LNAVKRKKQDLYIAFLVLKKLHILMQISDFGLAKWLPDQWTHHIVSNFEGTFGFVNPKNRHGFLIL